MVWRSNYLAVFFFAAKAFGLPFPDCTNGPLAENLVCNPLASPSERAAALVAALTIDEKLVNLVEAALKGSSKSLGAPRIGLPAYYWWNEALHGVGLSAGITFATSGDFSFATSFANPITLAAAFDDELIEKIGSIISTEVRAFSNAGRAGLSVWTPNINPFKDPRWGRGLETPGEDTFRIKKYVKYLLSGLEGGVNPPTRKLIATCKHFTAYDIERWGDVVRYGFNAVVSSQELVEYYMPPFQQCARDSQVGSIMCSYNAVNGVPSCANEYLLQTILREHWEWTEHNNYIVSDCNAIQNFYANHHYVETPAEAAAAAYIAGTDNVCEAGYSTDVAGAYEQSLLSEATIDTALKRQYEGLIRTGFFDPDANSTEYRKYNWANVNTLEAQELARSSAAAGTVLLKNDGILPLKSKNLTLGVIGYWANASRELLGAYVGVPPYTHSPLWAAEQLGYKINYATGPLAQNETTGNWTDPALSAAIKSDIILYFGGIDNSVEGEDLDRYSIAWPSSQIALISQLSTLGKPIIVTKMGTGIDDSFLLSNPNISAIVWAGYGGQDSGSAVFDILTGKIAPAGRLPFTVYPTEYVDQIPMTEMSLRPSSNSPGRTYKFYDAAVEPFGSGLHYTNFVASFDEKIDGNESYHISEFISECHEKNLDLCDGPKFSIVVENAGKTTSDFVALVFVSHENGLAPYPLKELVGYERLRDIQPGESRKTSITLSLGSISRIDEAGNTVLYPGDYSLLLDVPTQAKSSFTLVGEEQVLDLWPQPPTNGTS